MEVRAVLKLALELMESPELYDFRFASGVARADVGVADNFRGGTTGESVAALASAHTGGGGGMLAMFMLCVCGIIDMRFIRLVSVGLIVLAPRPLAWAEWPVPGIMEALLLPPDVGVKPFEPIRGDRVARDRRFDSGAPTVLLILLLLLLWPAWATRGGGCTDFALVALEVLSCREESEPSMEVLVESVPPRSDARLDLRRCVVFDAKSESVRMPGPMDLRGGFAVFVFETGG
jgi:hypothetical protein